MKKIILTVAIITSLIIFDACDKVAQCDEKRESIISDRDTKIEGCESRNPLYCPQCIQACNKQAEKEWEKYKNENDQCQGPLD